MQDRRGVRDGDEADDCGDGGGEVDHSDLVRRGWWGQLLGTSGRDCGRWQIVHSKSLHGCGHGIYTETGMIQSRLTLILG